MFKRFVLGRLQGMVEWDRSPYNDIGGALGKGSGPAQPDYTGAANATAAGNAEAARIAAKANRVSQYTPYGSLVYSQTGQDKFDQAGYDKAMADYQSALQAYQAPSQTYGWINNGDSGSVWGVTGGSSSTLPAPVAPTRDQYTTKADPDAWRADVTLAPTQQKLLDAQNAQALALSGIGTDSLSSVAKALQGTISQPGDPQLRTSLQTPTGYQSSAQAGDLDSMRREAQQAIYSRQTSMLDPQYQRQQASLESQLANQGLQRGTEAYQHAMDDFSRQRDFAYGQARDSAITGGNDFADKQFQQGLANANLGNQVLGTQFQQGLASANFSNSALQQLLQQRLTERMQPLNELNALRTGSQVATPQFGNSPQQQTTPGADLLGATTAAYQGALGASNVRNASATNNLGTVGKLAAAYFLGGF